MAYNHNSAWFRDAPVKSVKICGEELLEVLNTCRSQSKVFNDCFAEDPDLNLG